MLDQRRHQRIRFFEPPPIAIGFGGRLATGVLENLSLAGFMVRTDLALAVGRHFGCEFSLFGSPVVDVSAITISRIGDLFGARFEYGPISERVLEDAIEAALAQGKASILTTHEIGGRRVMRISGGLNGGLRNDFMHALTRVGVDEIDTAAVTAVDQAGIALCLTALSRHGVTLGQQSECFARSWSEATRAPGKQGAAA
ncbi:MAG: PilZ domain-containing protein [Betaproteobacteria bacterium]|jgi:hypothetical protein|nr:PilZ domain-containing protein [Betaproteobacteria bacterium]HMV19634.1 PilZ domain-containing protein [Rhodocyclaceae bacterium]HMW76399.1 PilZ domain-containing protein [Rhodocyclaceae bacterium]HNE41947.1 PilZ domain-containing protein [Rhodocyclaceae bacterium]HNM20905.1 PilZ domain-containing protein [Rhodocyclaceae bacterium]